MKRSTIRDVAREANVSMGTVSRVAAGSRLVAEATRARVQAVMQRLDYVPNVAARAMRTSRSMLVGLLVPDFSNPIFAKVAKAAELTLSQSGYTLFLRSSERLASSEIEFLSLAERHQMDGVIVSLSDERDAAVLGALRAFRAPVVILDRDTDLDCDVVFSEHADTLRRVTRHLIELGHRRIGLVAASMAIRPGSGWPATWTRLPMPASLPIPN